MDLKFSKKSNPKWRDQSMFQRFSKFARKNKVVKSGSLRFNLQFEALAANQSFKFPISKPKHYIYQKVSSKYTWWPESRSRTVPAPPPVVNKLQQTHQKQNPHIFSMQSWSWSGAGSQEPCCIPDYIILTNISPKISETDRDKVYFCREKKTGKKDCKKDGWKKKIYRARNFWLVSCQRTCQGCALSCGGEQNHETSQEKKHSYSQQQKHEQVTKQQHENHACHRSVLNSSSARS